MGKWGDRTPYGDVVLNLGLWYLVKAANELLSQPKFGGEDGELTIVQGCWSAADASKGTHSGMDALDTTAHNWQNREKVFRLLGTAYWHRALLPGVWGPHCHGVVDGGAASLPAQQQVTMYHSRLNGLADMRPDPGHRMVVFPQFVFPEKAIGRPGDYWTVLMARAHAQPTPHSPLLKVYKPGEYFKVVAVVNVDGHYWGINPRGKCVRMERLTRKNPKGK